MKLFKDLLTNLDKISMQAKKLNLKLENTIDSGKASIINIKDVKLKIKDLKLNNDKSNKAFEESKLSLNQLLKLTYNYLKNPTPEKALKVKNQINVSNNDLVKANNVFSENKIFADKVVVSFNKYKNGDFINNAKESFELNQKLIASLNKNIKIIRSVNKTKTKTKTKTRKVYFNETTPNPFCAKLRELIAEAKQNIVELYADRAKKYLVIFNQILIYAAVKLEYDKEGASVKETFDSQESFVDDQRQLMIDYNRAGLELSIRNGKLIDLTQKHKENMASKNEKKIEDSTLAIATEKFEIQLVEVNLKKAIKEMGSISDYSVNELRKNLKIMRDDFEKKYGKNFKALEDVKWELRNSINDLDEERFLKRVNNYRERIKELESELIFNKCPK